MSTDMEYDEKETYRLARLLSSQRMVISNHITSFSADIVLNISQGNVHSIDIPIDSLLPSGWNCCLQVLCVVG